LEIVSASRRKQPASGNREQLRDVLSEIWREVARKSLDQIALLYFVVGGGGGGGGDGGDIPMRIAMMPPLGSFVGVKSEIRALFLEFAFFVLFVSGLIMGIPVDVVAWAQLF
jgi:hypothetical protein